MGVLAGERFTVWVPVSPVVRVVTESDQWLVRAGEWMRLPFDEGPYDGPGAMGERLGRLGFGEWRPWVQVLWVPSPWGDKLQIHPDPPHGYGVGIASSPVVAVRGDWVAV